MYISNLGKGHVTKVRSFAAKGDLGLIYTPGYQPFNKNFAYILFELREAGQNDLSFSAMDYAWSDDKQLTTRNVSVNANYLQSYRISVEMHRAD